MIIDRQIPESQQNQKDNFGLVIVRWESFRLLFNILLVITCLGHGVLANPANFGDFEFWKYLVIGAVLANLLFMTGPALDGYLTWYGIWTAPIALLAFMCGTGLTMMFAIAWIYRY